MMISENIRYKKNMANGRQLYRKYAQHLGKEAVSFVEVEQGFFGESDTLITKDSKGILERTTLIYKDFVHWIVAKCKVEIK